jgi:hypothetical protein
MSTEQKEIIFITSNNGKVLSLKRHFQTRNSFSKQGKGGKLTRKMDTTDCPHAWSDIWRIYEIPKYGKTLSALTQEELCKYKKEEDNDKSSLELFVEWYVKNNNK